METILVLTFIGLSLLCIAFNKKDSTLLFFSGIFLSFCGLDILQNINLSGSFGYGIIITFSGLYIMIRTAIEVIVGEDKSGKIKLFKGR